MHPAPVPPPHHRQPHCAIFSAHRYGITHCWRRKTKYRRHSLSAAINTPARPAGHA
ncbi:hypothetical protein LGT44_11180 [Thalassolituus sp. TMPB967]|nr:hypothetical protein [Thalassolituus alkanivorans]MCB2423608.1 hypothetical protein [Thalassolituus alkanivorans]